MASSLRKVCLVTGGSSGVGLDAARQLLQKGHHVILGCRSIEKGKASMQSLQTTASNTEARVEYVQIDLGSLQSVRNCAKEVLSKHKLLDVLVCNAGVLNHKFSSTADGFENTYQVNHLSHFLLCHLLMPALLQSAAARVVCVSSELHRSLGQVPASPTYLQQLNQASPYPGMQIYGLSKLYNIWFVRQLATMLPPNVICNAVTPGFVPSTSLNRNSWFPARLAMSVLMRFVPFAVSVQTGAERVVNVCVGGQEGKVSGKYFSKGVDTESSPDSYDIEKARILWESSLNDAGVALYMP